MQKLWKRTGCKSRLEETNRLQVLRGKAGLFITSHCEMFGSDSTGSANVAHLLCVLIALSVACAVKTSVDMRLSDDCRWAFCGERFVLFASGVGEL
jgi:hypothetical protein